MKKTAVELLATIFYNKAKCISFDKWVIIEEEMEIIIEQAKEMEKDQIINAFVDGADKGEMFNNENRAFKTDAKQYYNETFKSE